MVHDILDMVDVCHFKRYKKEDYLMYKAYIIRSIVIITALCLVAWYCYGFNIELDYYFAEIDVTKKGTNGVEIPVHYIIATYVWIALSIHFLLLLFLWKYPKDSFFRLSILFPMLILFIMEFIQYGVQCL